MSKTIVFFPEGAYGPTNNCVGIGQVLRERGHRVVFVVEESFAGTLEAQGFEERLMRLGPPPEVEEAPGQFWKDFIRETAPVFRKPTIEQLGEFIEPTFRALCDGARYVDERLREIFGELQPDVIVEDNVVAFPAIAHSGTPWVRLVSCNPLELKDPASRPVFSGYPRTTGDGWDAFRAEYLARPRRPARRVQRLLRRAGRRRRSPTGSSSTSRPGSTSTLYPAEIDYAALAAARRRPGTGSTRPFGASTPSSSFPTQIARGEGRLVYLSLGSLGSADVELMRRLVDGAVAGAAPVHRLEGAAGRPSTRSPTTCGAPSSCPSRRSCRSSTS